MPIDDGVIYRLEIVGGPWDGLRGFTWWDDGEHPPPELIFIGTCPGDGCCNDTCPGKRHPAFWAPNEGEDTPVKAIRYDKQEEYVHRIERRDHDDFEGVAAYVLGGTDVLALCTGAVGVPAGVAA